MRSLLLLALPLSISLGGCGDKNGYVSGTDSGVADTDQDTDGVALGVPDWVAYELRRDERSAGG